MVRLEFRQGPRTSDKVRYARREGFACCFAGSGGKDLLSRLYYCIFPPGSGIEILKFTGTTLHIMTWKD